MDMKTDKGGENNLPFMAFSDDSESTAVLKQFVTARKWPEGAIHSGNINTAAAFLKTNHSPKVLFVDIASADTNTVSASLDTLADVCEPGTTVIVSGKVNEYSFYCWLVEVGISHYLLKPFKLEALEAAYSKATEVAVTAAKPENVKKDAKIITVIGSRGGVGTTTVCVNMAWILANRLRQKTALLDFDPQLGTIALALDLEPGRGLREALEKPERIDSLFVDRVMVRVDDYLSILSTEEPMEETIITKEAAAESLFKQCRPKFSHIIVDLPRVISPYTRYAVTHADHVVCVTELSIAGLRDSLRCLEYCRDSLKIKPPVFVANKIGLAGKHQMERDEFEKGLGTKVAFQIPFIIDAHAAATSGEVLAEIAKNTPAAKALQSLSEHFAEVPADGKAPSKQNNGLFSLLKRSA